ncbi:MAG: type VI secretion system protein TssA [Desulfobacterales bacterium]|nr:type VI secretion system protein TssA [Desulfobacterales bacterium]MDD4073219.1 type VI secretion system protein TssA [Desulfobacterales bacterium]MDD4393789.1 type VI secretion system protein TssA [Desulfobacterales bacterium]
MTTEEEKNIKSDQLISSTSDRAESIPPDSNTDIDTEPFALGLNRLLNPISDQNPAGEFLRYEGTYDKISEARREDNEQLPQGVWARDLKKAEWNQVWSICSEALEKRTKDLQIAVWMLESLMHLYGYAGLKEGLRFILRLCEKFWDQLYPELVEDDLESRLSPFYWMNEKLAFKLKMLAITRPQSTANVDAYTFSQWEKANQLEQLAAKDKSVLERAESEGQVTRPKFLGSVMFSTKSFYEKQCSDLRASLGILSDLGSFLDAKSGNKSPGFNQFKTIIEQIENLSNTFLEQKTSDSEPDSSSDSEEIQSEHDSDSDLGKRPSFLSIRNRAAAYRMLSEAADYLLIHEPHSPTPYLVKRAVSWGNMTLTELLQELVNDERDLQQIFKLLGLANLN